MPRHDGDHRHLDDLAHLAHQAINELVAELRWKRDLSYGPVATETSGRHSNVAADPTHGEVATRQALRRRHAQVMGDLRWLVDRKLPQMLDRLETADDGPLMSDEDRGARVDGGLSAYRQRHGARDRAPAGRPELRDALEAQRRRLARGEGWGAA